MRGLCLMYHDVADGTAAAEVPAGASLYRISTEMFRRHLRALGAARPELTTVGDFAGRAAAPRDAIALTFDDGWKGSLTTGLQCLLEQGVRATFFVTRDYVGRRGFAGPSLLREAHAAGMEIGAHGVTHRFLRDLTESEIRAELEDSRAFLENLLDAPVTTGSVPGGDWSPTVARIAAECGYTALCTSRPGINDERTDPLALRRVAIRRGTSVEAVERYAQFHVGREVLRSVALDVPRRLMGRNRYAAIRARLLGDDPVTAASGRI